MAATANETIMYEIRMDAAATLLALDDLAKKGLTVADAFKLIQQAVQQTATSTGRSMAEVLAAFEEVSGAVEGLAGGKGLFNQVLSGSTGETPEEVKAKLTGVMEDMKQVGETGQAAYTKTAAATTTATTAARGFFDVTNMVRMALGTLEAMVIFQVVMALGNAFREATTAANEYYQALINVTVAQGAMAQQGIATTNQELLAMADALEKKIGIFAHVDMVDAVSQAALLTAQFKLSTTQIDQVVQMASLLASRTPGKTPTEFIDNILQAAKGSSAQWALSLGISLDANAVKAKALSMGLWDGVSAISEQAKETAGLTLLWERLGPQMDSLQKNIHSSTEISTQLSSTWKNFMEMMGTYMSPVMDFIKGGLIYDMEVAMKLIKAYNDISEKVYAAMAGALMVVVGLQTHQITNMQQLVEAYNKGHDAVKKFYDELDKRRATGGVDLSQNAPVVPQSTVPELEAPPSLKPSDFDAIYKAYQSYYEGVIKATEDFNLRMKNLQDEYNLNVQKEIENTNLRIAEERQNFRLKQIQAEQDFQQRMRELTNRYLLDLEDALRKRDAEAVIKIIERYNMEKETAKQQEDLRRQQAEAAEKLKIQQMRQEEQLRLKQMAEEYKLQQEEARRSYQNQLTDLARALDQKLQEQAAKLAQEYKLNNEGMEKLYKLFQQYYGPAGKFATEQQSSYLKMVEQSQAFVDQMTTIMNQYYGMLSSLSTTGGASPKIPGGGLGSPPPPKTGYAAGGIAMANSATSVTFGEAGPELALFLPMNAGASAGGNMNVFGGGGGMMGGQALIRIEVGSDLEARIVNAALSHAAIAIEKVNRSR